MRIAKIDNISLSTCEIAHAKEILGFHVRQAHNRIDPNQRTKNCHPEKLRVIRSIVRDLSRHPVYDHV